MVLDEKPWQKYTVNASVPQDSILTLMVFLLYINGIPDDVICNTVIMLMTLHSSLSAIGFLIFGL